MSMVSYIFINGKLKQERRVSFRLPSFARSVLLAVHLHTRRSRGKTISEKNSATGRMHERKQNIPESGQWLGIQVNFPRFQAKVFINLLLDFDARSDYRFIARVERRLS
jgi:hypothetical protein